MVVWRAESGAVLMFAIIGSLLTSRLGGWIAGGLAVAAVLVVLKWEHAAKLKAQAAQASAEQGLRIGYEGYVKLYQEREAIKAKFDQKRGKLNVVRQTRNLDDLSRMFNNPDGVLPAVRPNSQRRSAAPARYRAADGSGPEYEEAY